MNASFLLSPLSLLAVRIPSLRVSRLRVRLSFQRLVRPFYLFALVGAAGSVAYATDEVQTITLSNVTAASVAITSPDYTGAATFAPGATAAQVQTALEVKFGAGTVNVTGSSAIGHNIAPTVAITGTASAIAALTNGDTGDTCTFVRTATGDQYADFDLGAGNATLLTQFRAFQSSLEALNGGQFLVLYGSNTGNFNGEEILLTDMTPLDRQATNTWLSSSIRDTVPYRWYRVWYRGDTTSPLIVGEIELHAGTGYYGTYIVTFTGSKSNLNVASMATSTVNAAATTTTEGTEG